MQPQSSRSDALAVVRRGEQPAAFRGEQVSNKDKTGAEDAGHQQRDIKNEILTKLAIEREVREQLARQQSEQGAPPKKSRWAWLESKLALLVIGAIVSGVLVPVFNRHFPYAGC